MPPLNYHGFLPSQENSIDADSIPEVEESSVAEAEPPSLLPSVSPPLQQPAPPDSRPTTAPTPLDPVEDPDCEPSFKTAKEKECWQMFRKMADKGVSISYDTVLRGMLTPTEYRLHKKSMSSTC